LLPFLAEGLLSPKGGADDRSDSTGYGSCLDEGDAADRTVLGGVGHDGEAISRLDTRANAKVFGQDELSALVHADDSFQGATRLTHLAPPRYPAAVFR
jgi:hypothetical protein